MDSEASLSLYRTMLKIRRFEERVSYLFSNGEIEGFYHLYIGQEAVAAGACAVIDTEDYITSTHRGHGHVIAKGASLDKMMAEMFGRVTGYCRAKGGSLHISVPELGILGANGIVGGGIPIATGAGLSSKILKNNRVSLCFFGDGASNQGTFHESINIASAFDLPVIYICENNLYGVGTRQTKVRNVEDIACRAAAYGIHGAVVDGNDVEEVYEEVSKAVDRARKGKGPSLIECKTYRWHTHFEGEPDTYRPKDEVLEWKQKEPIGRYAEKLVESGVCDRNTIGEIDEAVIEEIDKAVCFAKESPLPEPHLAIEDVYV